MNLLVMGASRFTILNTVEDRPYLRAQIRIIPEAGDDLEATARLTEATALAFREYSNLLRELVGQRPDEAEPPMEGRPGLRRGRLRHEAFHLQPIDVLLGPRARALLRGSRQEEAGRSRVTGLPGLGPGGHV